MPRPLFLQFVALAGIAMSVEHTRAQSPQSDFVNRTDTCIAAWGPTSAERRFDEIGWSTEIRVALTLAKEHQRPVFLFTHDGRMAVGRQ